MKIYNKNYPCEIIYILLCVWVFCLHVRLYILCMLSARSGQKALAFLGLEIQSIHVMLQIITINNNNNSNNNNNNKAVRRRNAIHVAQIPPEGKSLQEGGQHSGA